MTVGLQGMAFGLQLTTYEPWSLTFDLRGLAYGLESLVYELPGLEQRDHGHHGTTGPPWEQEF
jgi:hypothetical protein